MSLSTTSLIVFYFQILLVTGGRDGSGLDSQDSVEVFVPALGCWASSRAKLPRPMTGLSAANINGRVLIFGIFFKSYTRSYAGTY